MTSSEFRERARQMLRGKWGMAILTTFVAGILGGLLVSASTSLNIDLDVDILSRLPKFIRTYLAVCASIGGVLGIAQFIVGGTVQLGYCKYLLKLHDNEPADIKDIFSEFAHFGNGFLLSLLTGIYVFLWSLLFVIPGIVATYKYALAPFIMQEIPNMTPSEAIAESKRMMDGHKWELFILDLSFIGWEFLSLLTLGVGALFINPYKNAARAVFYRYLSPAPIAPAFQEQPTGEYPWNQENI